MAQNFASQQPSGLSVILRIQRLKSVLMRSADSPMTSSNSSPIRARPVTATLKQIGENGGCTAGWELLARPAEHRVCQLAHSLTG